MTAKEIQALTEEWLALWPKGVMSGGGSIKSDIKVCFPKMARFVKLYPEYLPETIIAATKDYLLYQKAKRWEYTTKATNFISHLQKGSLLKEWCERELADDEEEIPQEPIEYDYSKDFI